MNPSVYIGSDEKPRTLLTAPTLDLAQNVIDAALQPLVEARSGHVVGYEALMRGHDLLGFKTPIQLLDHMHLAGSLGALESLLRQRALGRFKSLGAGSRYLFVNIDGRHLTDPEQCTERLLADLKLWNIPATSVCVELSERDDHIRRPNFPDLIKNFRQHGIRIALDDFGTGYSELRILCDYGIDYIKIDRHFVSGITNNARNKLFVTTLAELAHILGIHVIAEGVETEDEYSNCVEAGCDFIQGYFVARPTLICGELQDVYPVSTNVRNRLHRVDRLDEYLVRSEMQALPTLRFNCDLEHVFELFAQNPMQCFFPVVDNADVPLGIIHEREIKGLIYSPYGRDIIRNKAFRPSFDRFVTATPIADIGASADSLLNIFANTDSCDALILTENAKYCGIISSSSLLKVLYEKNIRVAQDLNSLTKLPGNNAITDFIKRAASCGERSRILCYFDFDFFKPFNDAYGFARGDEAILLFARLMRERLTGGERFIGHVGGDDFFAGLYDASRESVEPTLHRLTEDFAAQIAELYLPDHRAEGYIPGVDRNGVKTRFPLMRCSVAALELDQGWVTANPEVIARELANLKGRAKRAADGSIWARFGAESA